MLCTSTLWGQQRVIFGEKAPSISTVEYLIDNKVSQGKSTYIEFFMVDSPHSLEQLEYFEAFAARYCESINFIIISRDDRGRLREFFGGRELPFSVAYDSEGKVFSLYGVNYVPSSALIDKKGDFIWQGRSSELTDVTLDNAKSTKQK